jgi:hypothetical protein
LFGKIKVVSPNNNCWILVITDYYSKWVELIPYSYSHSLFLFLFLQQLKLVLMLAFNIKYNDMVSPGNSK